MTNKHTIHTVVKVTQEAVDYLSKYEPVRGYWVAFSGGKDSIVIEKLCKLAGVKYKAGYARTGIDPPEVVSFIKRNYSDVIIMKPKDSFYKLIADTKCPPLASARWCCDSIKEKVGYDLKQQHPIHVTGVRAEESAKRARKPRLDLHKQIGALTVKPIFHWTEYHVWGFIEYFKLPYPKLYDEGFDRLGCVCCPMMFHKNQTKLNQHRERWPGIFRAFERAVKKWYERKNFTDCPHGSFEKYMESYYTGFEVKGGCGMKTANKPLHINS